MVLGEENFAMFHVDSSGNIIHEWVATYNMTTQTIFNTTVLFSFIDGKLYLLKNKLANQKKINHRQDDINSLSLLRYYEGQAESFTDVEVYLTITTGLTKPDLIKHLNQAWDRHYKAQELVVGKVNETGQPHPEGSFFMGKMDALTAIKDKLKAYC